MNQEQVSENVARAVSLEVAAAINYIHSQNIVHRDIKPENFLIWNKREKESVSVKLCDFGLAEEVPMYGLSRICGSPSFVAPEILQCQTYGLPVDVWSLGVVFYFLLCRFCPYEHENLQEKFEMIIANELKFPAPHWEDVSREAKSLIKRILVTNPKQRIKANTVLRDRWFQSKVNLLEIQHFVLVCMSSLLNLFSFLAFLNISAQGVDKIPKRDLETEIYKWFDWEVV